MGILYDQIRPGCLEGNISKLSFDDALTVIQEACEGNDTMWLDFRGTIINTNDDTGKTFLEMADYFQIELPRVVEQARQEEREIAASLV